MTAPASPEPLFVPNALQLRIWSGQRIRPGEPLYNMALRFDIEGALEPALFERAFRGVVAENDVLRSRFVEVDGEARVAFDRSPADAPFRFVDAASEPDPRTVVERWATECCRAPLELDGWLFDAVLLRTALDRHTWILCQHHVICDAWSATLLAERLSEAYAALEREGAEPSPSAPSPSFAATLERHGEGEPAFQRSAESAGPRTRTEGAGRSTRTERVTLALDADRRARLDALLDRPGVRGFSRDRARFEVLSTALTALEVAAGEAADGIVRVHVPVHGRATRRAKRTAGLFLDVLALEIDAEPSMSLAELHGRIRSATAQALRAHTAGTSQPERPKGRTIVVNDLRTSFEAFAERPTRVSWLHPGHGDAEHSIRLQVVDFAGSGELELHFDLHCDEYGPRLRAAFPELFVRVLDALFDDFELTVDRIELTGEDERRRRIAAGDRTRSAEREHATVVHAFEDVASRCPDALAVREAVPDGRAWTYAELEHRSRAIAGRLGSAIGDVGAPQTVALHAARSADFVAAVLGVLRAGHGYVPLDASWPAARVRRVLEAAAPALVLTDHTVPFETTAPVLSIAEAANGEAPERLDPPVEVERPAYTIFTSGSTGAPKGVVVAHGSLADYALWAARAYAAPDASRGPDAALFTSVAVDLTVTSLFAPLVSGGTVHVHPQDDGAVDLAVLRVLADDSASLVKLTPAHLDLALRSDVPGGTRLTALVVGGEAFPRSLARRAVDHFGERVAVYNEYGPTEATVACMLHRFDAEHDATATVPIGEPRPGATIDLVGPGGRLVPDGLPGEIVIGGAGLAVGYVDGQTGGFGIDALRPGERRVYATGDLARRDPATGALEFLGRRDEQVKIRGFRVEPAEIRATLEGHPAVRSAFVTTRRAKRSDAAVETAGDPRWRDVRHCVRCGLASNHPEARLDATGTCALCLEFETYRADAEAYFGTPDGLLDRLGPTRDDGSADCIALLSGGKDSTYALYQLVAMGRRPLVFSLDNGYIAEGAKANIRRVVEHLGLELVFATTASMNAIFRDSLEQFSNVCQGCFKTIYTLSTRLAKERGITRIVTGLSRGQIFETRLAPLLRAGIREAAAIDRTVVAARRSYHRVDDAVSRHLDVSLFDDDAIFDRIEFVDFYRYCDVPLAEVLRFIRTEAAWRKPEDTGRSTNCLINDVGISVHKRERGFHNYALPYSWDVRLGHKTRDECLAELDDEIDESRVRAILREIGAGEARTAEVDTVELVAYVVTTGDIDEAELVRYAGRHLPAAMVPRRIVAVDTLPLAPSGKVDTNALPDPDGTPRSRAVRHPRGAREELLAAVWSEVLGRGEIGVDDHFLELGGDSILALQVVARARRSGLGLEPQDVFASPTIAQLARVAVALDPDLDAAATEPHGPAPLTPVQRWFLASEPAAPEAFAMLVEFESRDGAPLDAERLTRALRALVARHGALRSTFEHDGSAWRARVLPADRAAEPRVLRGGADVVERAVLDGAFDLRSGALVLAAIDTNQASLAIHHLAVDAVSLSTLLSELDLAYGGAALPAHVDLWRAHCVTAAETDGELPPTDPSAGAEGDATEREIPLPRSAGGTATDLESALVDALASAARTGPAGDAAAAVDVEGHGRGGRSADTVGWFTSIERRTEAAEPPGVAEVLLNVLPAAHPFQGGERLRARGEVRRIRASGALRTHAVDAHAVPTPEGWSLRLSFANARYDAGAIERFVSALEAGLQLPTRGAGVSADDLEALLDELDG